jgi:hypothetical protein
MVFQKSKVTALGRGKNDLATSNGKRSSIKRPLLRQLRRAVLRPNIDHQLDIQALGDPDQAIQARSVLTGLHASDIGLMNSKALGELPLREMMHSPKVRNLNGQPAGQRRPLPLSTELRIAKVLRKNILVSYELIFHVFIPLITSL